MTEKILSKLNPVHLPTVSEFGKIADIICHNQTGGYEEIIEAGNIRNRKTLLLQSRFEELTRGKWVTTNNRSHDSILMLDKVPIFQPALLKKEMFVCDLEKPKGYEIKVDSHSESRAEQLKADAYTEAQSQLWFEGFELGEIGKYTLGTDKWIFTHDSPSGDSIFFGEYHIKNPTVFDFIIELDRYNYNRTASEKIKINFTENFVKELLK